MNNSFTEEDKKKFTEFLNSIAENATFTHNTEGLIRYFKLLAHMQQAILPKINSNIMEVKRIVDPEPIQKQVKKKASPRK